MSDFILVPGAGGIATPYWRRVSSSLQRSGHRAFPVDLPGSSPDAGLPEYSALVADAIQDTADPVVVAQSLGAFAAVMACSHVQARSLVLVNAMVPAPGETPGEWWGATGAVAARTLAARSRGYTDEFELATYFLHDLNPDDAAAVLADPGHEADIVFGQPCAVDTWPEIPTAAIVGSDDRLFPLEFQQQLLVDRAGVTPVVMPGGHLLALANPDGLTEALVVLTHRADQ
ncbi:MAG TPA: alpha/beta hydrolase [Acidimicrobiales bacterium]